jgi:Ni/Co efflux regulator RcnB
MIRKLFLVVTLLAATCMAGLFGGSSLVPSSSAMTSAQNDNRDRGRDNRMDRRRHRRHERRWHRRHRRHRNGNMNR